MSKPKICYVRVDSHHGIFWRQAHLYQKPAVGWVINLDRGQGPKVRVVDIEIIEGNPTYTLYCEPVSQDIPKEVFAGWITHAQWNKSSG